MKSYKYKIQQDKDCSDENRAKPRKAFNSAERLKAKTEIREEISTYPKFSKQEMRDIAMDLYEESHAICEGNMWRIRNFTYMLEKLKIITEDQMWGLYYPCTCPKYRLMTKDELLTLAGYILPNNP